MRCALLTAVLSLVAAAPAAAQLPPTLSADAAFAPPTGIARGDFTPGTIADIPAAVAVDGERIYTVGRTQGGSGGQDIGILARRTDGVLDTSFSGDGKLIVSIAPTTESDAGTGIAVLPDHRVRVIAATDVAAGAGESADVAIVGLNADGTPDTTFGTPAAGGGPERTGRIVFSPGPSTDVPHRIAVGADGRLAIVGSRSDGSRDDFFVSLREPDGTPVTTFGTNGIKTFNRAGAPGGVSLIDRGIDVELRPGGGVLALLLVETSPTAAFDYTAVLHAFTATGADDTSFSGDGDLVLAVGDPDTIPGGLVAHGGRYYVSGSTAVAADTDAFLARVEADGSGLDFRRFDMRGRLLTAAQPVISRAGQVAASGDLVAPGDLVVVPGSPPTLVAVGSVEYATDIGSTAIDWAAAAFHDFEGPLAAAGFGDIVLQAPGQFGLGSAAAGASGWLAVSGRHLDASTADNSFGAARLLIDADKACDLGVTAAEPAEITFRGSATAAFAVTVRNDGTRACEGALDVPAPYRLPATTTGMLAPGASATVHAADLVYAGPRRSEDVLIVTLTAPGDGNAANDRAAINVAFSYCELGVSAVGGAGWIPDEGVRRFQLDLRNNGTAACRVRVGSKPPYALGAGKSVTDRVGVRAPAGARAGTRTPVVLHASATDDVDPANNAVTRAPLTVRVGDSDLERWGARGFRGSATGGSAGALKSPRLRPARVHVSVLRTSGERCGWLKSARGDFTRRTAGTKGGCGSPRWLRAKGTGRWRYALRRSLEPGRYTVSSRTTIRAGFREARFGAKDRNKVSFRIR